MKIAIDAMGGDIGPKATVYGAINAAKRFGYSICLVGKEEVLAKEIARQNVSSLDISIKDASQIVSMDDLPSVAVRQKKDSSISIAASIVRSGEADAMVSAGNTGVVMATAKIFFRPLKGIDRPAIATILPSIKGIALLLDVGANVDCKSRHLLQFAIMGNAYAQQILHIPRPTIGILSIGSEESKGNELTRETFSLMRQTPFNFIGNVEGRDIFMGNVDVVVTDGFVGNVALKAGEGVGEMITYMIKKGIKKSMLSRIGSLLMAPTFKDLKKKIDYAEYGGAPLLGLNKVCIICHGISDSTAITNAIKLAGDFITHKVNTQISEDVLIVKKLVEEKERSLEGNC